MIIGISGKAGSGKDTTGKIINILANSPHLNNEGVLTFLRKDIISDKNWHIKKFADKLKDIVCLLIGCTREQLEDEEFKNTPLGDEWIWYERVMTPRLMMQLIGTECGRNIIHPQIWVNSTFAEYKPIGILNGNWEKHYQENKNNPNYIKAEEGSIQWNNCLPNWIITDMRFPNELEAVKKRGFSIRVERDVDRPEDKHISETSLDNAQFDYITYNNGSIEELIEKTREILKKESII